MRKRELGVRMKDMDDLRLYSIQQVADLSGLSRRTIDKLLFEGALRSVHVGHRRMIPREAYEDWLAALKLRKESA